MVLRLRKRRMIDHWMHLFEELTVLCYKANPRVGCLLEIASALYECDSYGRRNAISGATASVTCTNGVIHLGILNQLWDPLLRLHWTAYRDPAMLQQRLSTLIRGFPAIQLLFPCVVLRLGGVRGDESTRL